ncbi:MAG: hypothetical protein KatS3mg076_1901 [Candidatus Binatia bacterium]|nr:MAG: hypothetical protein KatS3mg076_1901 [Candidatus Binatia bacterium]
MELEIVPSIARVRREEWNALVGEASPFLEWEWLSSLEETGSAVPSEGWQAAHLLARRGGRLVAACPVYLKAHSEGEFVFDYAFAEAAERAGLRYYPKLLVGVPFTPVSGPRFLVAPEEDREEAVRALAAGLLALCREHGLSSVHVNFCLAEEARVLSGLGFHLRVGRQFHWWNRGWSNFEDYLASLRSKRRIQIRRERRELERQRVRIEVVAGKGIPDGLFGPMYDLYASTTDKYVWGRRYLRRELFFRVRDLWRERLCFVLAWREGELLAGTFNVRKGDVLYGRYWGTFEELPFLHFNVCYYASLEYCLAQGLRRFEPGAGGTFKLLRGFEPVPTHSAHFFLHPGLHRAVGEYLVRERAQEEREIRFLRQHLPYRKHET